MKGYRTAGRDGVFTALLTGAALLILIGIWSAFVAWRADMTPSPSTESPVMSAKSSSAEAEQEGIQLARRIIVYVTSADSEGDTAEG